MWNDDTDDEEDWDDDDPYEEDWDDDGESLTVPCPECGTDVYEDAEQCPVCGHYLTRSSVHPFAGRSSVFVVLGVIGIIAVILVLTVV